MISTLPVGPLGWTVEVAPASGGTLRTEYRVTVRDPAGVAVHSTYVPSWADAVEVARYHVACRVAL